MTLSALALSTPTRSALRRSGRGLFAGAHARGALIGAWCAAVAAFIVAACDTPPSNESAEPRQGASSGLAAGSPSAHASEQGGAPGAAAAVEPDGSKAPSAAVATSASTSASKPASQRCPDGMRWVPGGSFWVGSPGTHGPPDEHPRFSTKLPALCVDETEVTVSSYQRCVEAGKCQVQPAKQKTCNYGRQGREQHPMNCVTQEQAKAFCAQRGARLPSEVEWEYFARGGSEQRPYSWGDQPPGDSVTCWKRPHSCEVRSFPAGAFGLYDVIGNVWEWTDSDYGPYPWAARGAPHEVYRGGSWSRRFDKWMSPTLRNRWGRDKWGSHLGLRCVSLAPGAQCPYGADGQQCLRGVEQVECEPGTEWNGARCAKAGEAQCRAGQTFSNGYGCESEQSTPVVAGGSHVAADITAGVSVARSPKFDADCMEYQPNRPVAYRLSGGSHLGRNQVGKQRGCKNRDVGVGWNSACCPK